MSVDPSAKIHPSAVIEEGATIGAGAEIGPFTVIGPDVKLAAGVIVKSHVVITGRTTIGTESEIYQFASIGEIPQDLKFMGENTELVIGARNRIREGVTMNTGTDGGGGVTRVGDDCLFMTGAHVGHDAQVGNRVVVANQSAIAGHCNIEDDVIIGGLVGIHQFVRIGRGAFIGAVAMVANDVIPYGMVQAPRGDLDGLNLVGLKRRGLTRDDIQAIRAAYRALADGEGPFQDRARALRDAGDNPYVAEITEFILSASDRHFLTPR
jgi:UDP-N-acetylglucosamine acyltransferase